MTTRFKLGFDKPALRPCAPVASGTWNGIQGNNSGVCYDMRNDNSRDPHMYLTNAGSVLTSWSASATSPTRLNVAVAWGGGSQNSPMAYHPAGPSGSINASGATTTQFALTTALPAAVNANGMANKGDGIGYTIRVIGLTAGKVEERRVIANTAGTTPTILLESPLTFTPASGDLYEILSGTVFNITTSNTFFKLDVLTNFASSISAVSKPSTTFSNTEFFEAMSELYVPFNRNPGDGYLDSGHFWDVSKRCILASAATANTITATTLTGGLGGGTGILTNEYRNFQVRVVQDTVTPAAVGQRRRILSHTSGATPVFTTVTNWTTTPSSSARFVVELDDDHLLYMPSGTAVATYNIRTNAWDNILSTANANTSTYHRQGFPAWFIERDPLGSVTQGQVLVYRGTGTTFDVFDIAGTVGTPSASGSWQAGVTFYGAEAINSTGLQQYAGKPIPNWVSQRGRFSYLETYQAGQSGVVYRVDVKARCMEVVTVAPGNAPSVTSPIRGATVAFDPSGKLFSAVFAKNASARSVTGLAYWDFFMLDCVWED